jgi:hypothetical protein
VYGLLLLRPWELGRCTVREVEHMIAGYVLRRTHERDLLAWHAVYLMQATGNYSKDTQLTARTLLGRDPLPLDPRWQPEVNAEAAWERDLAQARIEAQVGKGVIGKLSDEELDLAYEQARITR